MAISRIPILPYFFLGAFLLGFPLVTGRYGWSTKQFAFGTLLIFSSFATAFALATTRAETISWTPFRRISAFSAALLALYGTALLATTYGLHRPAILLLSPLILGVTALLLRPRLLEMGISQNLRLTLSAFIITVTASCFLTSHQQLALAGDTSRRTGYLVFLSCVILFFIVTLTVRTTRLRNQLLVTALCGGAVASLVALWQFADFHGSARFWFLDLGKDPRPMGTLGHPNWFGTYLCLLFPLACAFFLQSRTRFSRVTALLFAALLFAALLVCQTRGAWLAGTVFLFGMAYCFRTRWKSLLPLWAAFALVTTVLLPSKNWQIVGRMGTFGPQLTLASEGSLGTGSGRFTFWLYALRHLPDHPFLGNGLDTYAAIDEEDPPLWASKAHSIYFEYALTLGLIGLTLYLLVLWQCLKSLPTGSTDLVAWGLKAAILTYLLQGIFIHDTVQTWPILWILAGLAATRLTDKVAVLRTP